MIIESLIFWIFAALAVCGALGVVFHRSMIYAALFLIVVFMSIAGFFVLNNADFLAVAQTLVYGVGLVIVILFGIMFTGDHKFQDSPVNPRQLFAYLTVGALFFAMLLMAALTPFPVKAIPEALAATYISQGSTNLLGDTLFNQYALPFEVVSVLLLLAMIGAIILSKKTFHTEPQELAAHLKYEMSDTAPTTEATKALSQATFHKSVEDFEPTGNDSTGPHPEEQEEEKEPAGV